MTRHKDRFTFALKLGGIYFLASLFLLTLLGAFVLTYWYPDSTWKILSTSKIFGIIVLSQIACGPLLIIIVSSSKKEKKELTPDLAEEMQNGREVFAKGKTFKEPGILKKLGNDPSPKSTSEEDEDAIARKLFGLN